VIKIDLNNEAFVGSNSGPEVIRILKRLIKEQIAPYGLDQYYKGNKERLNKSLFDINGNKIGMVNVVG
jgi:hypothetical protein